MAVSFLDASTEVQKDLTNISTACSRESTADASVPVRTLSRAAIQFAMSMRLSLGTLVIGLYMGAQR